jgi:hypothetical protein
VMQQVAEGHYIQFCAQQLGPLRANPFQVLYRRF